MPWFQTFCRHAGLMVHEIVKPMSHNQVVQKTTQEKKVSDRVTLRRTVIEEVEIQPPSPESEP